MPGAPTIVETAAGAAQLVKSAPTMQPSTYVLFVILLVLLGGFITIGRSLAASRPTMRKIEVEADTKLIDTLSARVTKLEQDLADQRAYYEAKLDRLQATYDASQSVARHELVNVKMRFRALVMLLKRLPNPPEMLIAILADIEAMEAEQTKAEAAEKGALTGAKLAVAGVKTDT